MSNERNEVIQAVVDRMTSYQDAATEGTVEKELREALGETDVDLSDGDVTSLVDAIEKSEGKIDVADVLG